MNRAIAAVYAISLRRGEPIDRAYTDEEKDKLIMCLPALMTEIERLERIARDPFVAGYVERFGLAKGESDGR